MIIGIDHGYYAIKTRHFSFPAGIAAYTHEPYTLQNTLEYGGRFFVCGTGRQPLLRSKTANDNYYLLTLAAIAKEIQRRGEKTTCSVTLAAGLPLAGFGREKKVFRDYLRRSSQPVGYRFEGIAYRVTIEDVKLFPQGYGITPSMSRKGNPYDNAMAENFFSILKTECIYRHKPATFSEANELIDRYIHFYNHERIQLKTGEAPLARRLST